MSTRKLGRLARLVFVVAALFAGGVGAAEISANHAGAPATVRSAQAAQMLEVVWE
ncbi:hypothetical protein [Actinoplanes sp. NPDC051411]|jgi:hypothetical protein|uniref:hypothetical protein n=1 Tax=Actinoplanes sp. NPDC051411 TaxID=3155522 RepID=UPI0034133A5E